MSGQEKLLKTNYHTHTHYCDGTDSPEEMILEAIAKGFDILGFSGHSHTPNDETYCMSPAATEQYRAELLKLREKYADKIKIRIGVEQDYFSDAPTDAWDFVIKSVHYLKKDGVYVSVDHNKDSLIADVAKHWGGDFLAFAEDYFALCEKAAEQGGDIFGHFDLTAKFNEGGALFNEADPRYKAAAEKAAEKVVESGILIEINTGAMAKGYRTAPYPALPLMRRMRDMDARFILSSDCHKRVLLDYGLEEAEALAKREGLVLVKKLPVKSR